MSQSLANVYLHLIFSTKNRIPIIDDQIAPELHRYLGGTCNALKCIPLKIGGYHDHVHILCKFSKTITLASLLDKVKTSSSKWIKTKDSKYAKFRWQDGYSAFSVSSKEMDGLINYIEHQKEHHAKRSFQDECRLFFKRYGVDYDERYVWD